MNNRIIHINEDTAKPENRTNLAMFSILMIPEIHTFFCNSLNIPTSSIIFPSPNFQTEEFDSNLRPDFKIIASFTELNVLKGYIEIELGREDQAQVSNYKSSANVPIYSIVGKKIYLQEKGNLSLEDIYYKTKEVEINYKDTQVFASLLHFQKLIEYYIIENNFSGSSKRAQISEKMLNSKIIQDVVQYFGKENIILGGKIEQRKLLIDTIKENGFSIRVYSRESTNNSVRLMNRSAGKPQIGFPSKVKLIKYFPYKKDEVLKYVNLIHNLGASDITYLKEKQDAKLPISIVEKNMNELLKAIESLL